MKNKNFAHRIIILIFGVIFIGLGVTVLLKANIGGDAVLVLQHGFTVFIGLTIDDIGLGILILNCILIVVLLLINKKMVNIGTFITSLLVGPVVSLYQLIPFIPEPNQLYIQIIMVIIGATIVSFGVALYILANAGYSPYDGILLTIQERTKVRFSIIKVINDIIMFSVGILLGGTFGIGSIISIVLFGPLIEMFLKILRPRLIHLASEQ